MSKLSEGLKWIVEDDDARLDGWLDALADLVGGIKRAVGKKDLKEATKALGGLLSGISKTLEFILPEEKPTYDKIMKVAREVDALVKKFDKQ